MNDELEGLLHAALRAEAPDWLEQLVTERAVASVEREAPSLGAASRRLRDGIAGVARSVRRGLAARRLLGGGLWARLRAAVPRPRVVLLGASSDER